MGRSTRADVVGVGRGSSLGYDNRVGGSSSCASGVHGSSRSKAGRNCGCRSRSRSGHSTSSRSHCSGSRRWTEGGEEGKRCRLTLDPVDVRNGEDAVGNAGHWSTGTIDAGVRGSLRDELAVDTVFCRSVLDDRSETRRGASLVAGRLAIQIGHLNAKVIASVARGMVTERRHRTTNLRHEAAGKERTARHGEDSCGS